MPYKFEVYKDKKDEFRVRFRAPNGEKMFASEGYGSKASAMGAIKSILKNGPKATIEDMTKAKPAAKPAKKAAKKAAKKKAAAKPKKASKPAAEPAPMLPPLLTP